MQRLSDDQCCVFTERWRPRTPLLVRVASKQGYATVNHSEKMLETKIRLCALAEAMVRKLGLRFRHDAR